MLNKFNTSTGENAITPPYDPVAVKSPCKFRETNPNYLSDSQVISPEREIVLWILYNHQNEENNLTTGN